MTFESFYTMLIFSVLFACLLFEVNAKATKKDQVTAKNENQPENLPTNSGDVFEEIDEESNEEYSGDLNRQVVLCWIETTTLVVKGDTLEEIVREYAVAVEVNSNLENFNFTAGNMYSSYHRDGSVVTFQEATQTTLDDRSRITIKRVKCVEGSKFKKTFMEWPDSPRKGVQISTYPVKSICESDLMNESKGGNCSVIVEKLHSELEPPVERQKSKEDSLESESDPSEEWDLEHLGLGPLTISSTLEPQDLVTEASSDSSDDEGSETANSNVMEDDSDKIVTGNSQIEKPQANENESGRNNGNNRTTAKPKFRRIFKKLATLPPKKPIEATNSEGDNISKSVYDTEEQDTLEKSAASCDSCHCCCHQFSGNKNRFSLHDLLMSLKFAVNYEEDAGKSPTIKIETQTEVHGKDDFEKIEQKEKIKTFLSKAFKSFVQQLVSDGILDRSSSNVSHNEKINTIVNSGNESNVDIAINGNDYDERKYKIKKNNNQNTLLLHLPRGNKKLYKDTNNNRKKSFTQRVESTPIRNVVTSETNPYSDEELKLQLQDRYDQITDHKEFAKHKITKNVNLDKNTSYIKDMEDATNNEYVEMQHSRKSTKPKVLKNMHIDSNKEDDIQSSNYKGWEHFPGVESAKKSKIMNNNEEEILQSDPQEEKSSRQERKYARQNGKSRNVQNNNSEKNKDYNDTESNRTESEHSSNSDSTRNKIPRRLKNTNPNVSRDRDRAITTNNEHQQNIRQGKSRQSDNSRGVDKKNININNVDAKKRRIESNKYLQDKKENTFSDQSEDYAPHRSRNRPKLQAGQSDTRSLSNYDYDYYDRTDRKGFSDSSYRDINYSAYDEPYPPQQQRFHRMAPFNRHLVSGPYGVQQKMLPRSLQQQRDPSHIPNYDDYYDIPQSMRYSQGGGSTSRQYLYRQRVA